MSQSHSFLYYFVCSFVRVCLCVCVSCLQDDGAIRVWKNFADLEKNPEMVTAWQGLSDMLPTTRGKYDHNTLF